MCEVDVMLSDNLKATVEFESSPGWPATRNSPETPPAINILHVLVAGNDIKSILNDGALDDIRYSILDDIG